MSDSNSNFPTRVLKLSTLEAASPFDPKRINQHIENLPGGSRVMTDAEVSTILNDPFATMVLRRKVFPQTLTELLAALDARNNDSDGLPQQSSFLIAEGGQVPFKPGLGKGHSRLITVRSRKNSPELLMSTLVGAGQDPRSPALLQEVIAWDPKNRTFHFYQRQGGVWFWCGQSDMALVPPTRGHGPFDSHVNGYLVMKELATPWVHWHGPGLGIAETAYAPDDPLVRDPLFIGKDNALNFEERVVRPLARRWNEARLAKATVGGKVTAVDQYFRQIVDSSTANLVSSHKEWKQIGAGGDLDDLPAGFFVDVEGLIESAGLPVALPPFRMTRARYKKLATKYALRVKGDGPGALDVAGDVPFCFTVPGRAFEDGLAVTALLQAGAISPRLVAALLMVDFPNPVVSPVRAALLSLIPSSAAVGSSSTLEKAIVAKATKAGVGTAPGAAAQLFLANWNLGPDGWRDAFGARVQAFVDRVAAMLATDDGADAIFRLAESRRREFRKRPLAEFGLTLPQATAIPESTPPLEITETGTVRTRKP